MYRWWPLPFLEPADDLLLLGVLVAGSILQAKSMAVAVAAWGLCRALGLFRAACRAKSKLATSYLVAT